MADNSSDQKITQLSEQLSALTDQLDSQNQRLAALENSWTNKFGTDQTSTIVSPQPVSQLDRPPLRSGTSPKGGSSLGKSGSFLAKLATICFMLVIALILRTMTDNELIAAEAGSQIGTAYAALLIAIGWRMISQKKRLGSIFPICGAMLMYALVLETHSRFDVYTSPTAYTILLLTLMPLVIMGSRYQLSLFHAVGLLGATFTAFAIDFPDPIFFHLALFLFAANVISFFCENKRGRRSQVFLYFSTILFWYLWTAKLHVPLAKGMEIKDSISLPYFLPLTILTVLTLMLFSAVASFRKPNSLKIFDIILPTINVLWLYPVCRLVVGPSPGDGHWLGYFGLILSAIHFMIAGIIFKFSQQGGTGICAYVVAGSTLVVMATLGVVDNVLPALPFLGAVAVALCIASQACEIGGIRLTSYVLPCVTTFIGISYGAITPGTTTPLASFMVVGSLALMSGFQYYWSRNNPLNCHIGFFASIDRKDYSAVILLIAALTNLFLMISLSINHLLLSHTTNPGNALLGTQSIVINLGAVAMMIYGLMKKNKEILYTAIGVVSIGALKALGYDLFKVQGIPLVLSIFSFGVAAAVGSFVMNRWSQTEH